VQHAGDISIHLALLVAPFPSPFSSANAAESARRIGEECAVALARLFRVASKHAYSASIKF
jgi:hypothetical protein